jgi:hypothetical protein
MKKEYFKRVAKHGRATLDEIRKMGFLSPD